MEQILNDINFNEYNEYIVIGVSAGPDSMCLLDILRKKTDKLVVAHINHNIRKESKEEEEYLKDYCQKNNIIFESMTITEYQENNFENEARKKRYTFYEEILKKYNSTKLFLAHHGDDLIETVLMKIERGSNLEGYAGIKMINKLPKYDIIRPLLPYTKEDIINYNKSHNITYYIDSSNTNTDYTRNWYRLKILPLLKEKDPNIHQKYLKYSKTLEEYINYIDKVTKELLPQVYKDNIINIEALKKQDKFIIKNLLYSIMNNIYHNQNNIITDKHIQSIISIIDNPKPNLTINLPQNKLAIKEYNRIIIKIPEEKTNYKIKYQDNLQINNMIFKEVKEEEKDGNNICRINTSKIKPPLYFRNRKDGDYIILKNSNNRKKIKEIFIEEKLSTEKRNTYPLLVDSNDNIIWIPNIKKSNLCIKKEENYDIILKCIEREENYEQKTN